MSVTIKTKEELDILREGGRRLATVVEEVSRKIRVGVSAYALDQFAQQFIAQMGDIPSFLNYHAYDDELPFPGALCVSINEGVVHGPPLADIILQEGDIVTIDCGIIHKGLFTDHARTFSVGKILDTAQQLLTATRESLDRAIQVAIPGNTTGDIGFAVESYVDGRYGIVRNLAGHGVGYDVHEDPWIPNFGKKGAGIVLQPGMVIAIEPMLTCGKEEVVLAKDGFTYVTKDKSLASHEEHTVIITEDGPEIVTQV